MDEVTSSSQQSTFAQPPSEVNLLDDNDLGEEELETILADAQDDEDDQEDLLDEGQEQYDGEQIMDINRQIEENQSSEDEELLTSFYLSSNDIRIGQYAVTKVRI